MVRKLINADFDHKSTTFLRDRAQITLDTIRKNPKSVFDALIHEHRTHQQSFMRELHTILANYAKQAEVNTPDARNEQAVQWARQASAIDTGFPFI